MRFYLEAKLRRQKPSEQQFIRAAREDGVYWRGDQIEFFREVYSETFRMRSMGARKYRAEAIDKLRALIGGTT